MRLRGRRLLAVAGSGLLLAALTSCAQAADGNAFLPGAGGGGGPALEPESSASPTPTAEVDSVTGGSTSITLDSAFTAALESLKVTPTVTGAATLNGGVLAFPITGGDLKAYAGGNGADPLITAELAHDGSGLTLSTATRKVTLDDLVVELGDQPRITGDVHVGSALVAQNATLFQLDTSSVTASTAGGQTVVDGATVTLSEGAAGALNSAFHTDAVTTGLAVGSAQVTVAGQ